MAAQEFALPPHRENEDGLWLLSLDGGGVRGLSTLYILRSIMFRLNAERKTQGLHEVKPCDVFDLIGGTSTGGYVHMKSNMARLTFQNYCNYAWTTCDERGRMYQDLYGPNRGYIQEEVVIFS